MKIMRPSDDIPTSVIIEEVNENIKSKRKEKVKAEKAPKSAKAKKKEEKAAELISGDQQIEKKLRTIVYDPADGKIKIDVDIATTTPPEKPDGESETIVETYSINSPRRPHKDLVAKLKKLTKFALDADEINVENPGSSYIVSKVKIDGDMLLKKSRATMVIAHEVERTGKWLKIPVSQITMYGNTDFIDAEKMSRVIEELQEEVWLYIKGKQEIESTNQLFLF